jgi:hypothetical protein
LSTGELLSAPSIADWNFIEFAPGVCGTSCKHKGEA